MFSLHMPSQANESVVAERFEFVTNPDVTVWEEIVRLVSTFLIAFIHAYIYFGRNYLCF